MKTGRVTSNVEWDTIAVTCNPGGGGGTPYDDQCTMLGGLGSIFELGSIP